MSTILYFDCFSGASGNMILGALIDAGLPLEELRGALGAWLLVTSVCTRTASRAQVSARRVFVWTMGKVPTSARADTTTRTIMTMITSTPIITITTTAMTMIIMMTITIITAV